MDCLKNPNSLNPLNLDLAMSNYNADLERQEGERNSLPVSGSGGSDTEVGKDITNIKSDSNFVYMGDRKYLKSELRHAFGGTLNPGGAPSPSNHFANPAPLGLSAFALTTFVLSLVNCQARSVTEPNIVIGLAVFYGGLIQLLAGMWEISLENTFGGLALSSYGGFWMSYAAIFIPWFNIAGAYETAKELENAVGFYLVAWTIFTYGLCSCTLKSTLMFFSLFFMLGNTFLLLTIGAFAESKNVTKAGGVLGVITAFIAWYNAYAGLATKSNSYLTVKGLQIPVWGTKRE
ncbi:Accumulation of DYads [Brettanomyces nanus]|uniref:Accumulation of DYads n=1 Tax=Eeniella nana TaxID=13502 RepID=A0A875S9Z5_EENNA|nr:Accumulation of DYads [Brettanomyces nanus]QPG76925.1 Accumulation of DYads [Brettanomyces nanus]